MTGSRKKFRDKLRSKPEEVSEYHEPDSRLKIKLFGSSRSPWIASPHHFPNDTINGMKKAVHFKRIATEKFNYLYLIDLTEEQYQEVFAPVLHNLELTALGLDNLRYSVIELICRQLPAGLHRLGVAATLSDRSLQLILQTLEARRALVSKNIKFVEICWGSDFDKKWKIAFTQYNQAIPIKNRLQQHSPAVIDSTTSSITNEHSSQRVNSDYSRRVMTIVTSQPATPVAAIPILPASQDVTRTQSLNALPIRSHLMSSSSLIAESLSGASPYSGKRKRDSDTDNSDDSDCSHKSPYQGEMLKKTDIEKLAQEVNELRANLIQVKNQLSWINIQIASVTEMINRLNNVPLISSANWETDITEMDNESLGLSSIEAVSSTVSSPISIVDQTFELTTRNYDSNYINILPPKKYNTYLEKCFSALSREKTALNQQFQIESSFVTAQETYLQALRAQLNLLQHPQLEATQFDTQNNADISGTGSSGSSFENWQSFQNSLPSALPTSNAFWNSLDAPMNPEQAAAEAQDKLPDIINFRLP